MSGVLALIPNRIFSEGTSEQFVGNLNNEEPGQKKGVTQLRRLFRLPPISHTHLKRKALVLQGQQRFLWDSPGTIKLQLALSSCPESYRETRMSVNFCPFDPVIPDSDSA